MTGTSWEAGRGTMRFVRGALDNHHYVAGVDENENGLLRISREDPERHEMTLSDVEVAVVSVPQLKASHFEVIADHFGSLDGIVNPGKGHHNMESGLRAAGRLGIALQVFREFFRALREEKLTDYVKKTRAYVQSNLPQHSRVTDVSLVCEEQLRVGRVDMDPIDIILTEVYLMGIAELHSALAEHPNVDAVVNIGGYNKYSTQAKERAREMGKGLFTYGELWGAVNFSGERFVNYTSAKGR